MNKKFLLALAGVVLSLGSSAALKAQEVTAGFDVGYRQTTDKTTAGSAVASYEQKTKGIKHLLLKAHAEALFENQICFGGELRYGFAMGKAKNDYHVNGVRINKEKIKNKANLFEGDASVGYHFAVTDGFTVVPIVGYEFQKYRKKDTAPFTKTLHSPFAGIKFVFKPADEFAVRAKVTYGWPKLKHDFSNSDFSDYVPGVGTVKKRAKNWKANVGFDYAIDDAWDLAIDLGFNRLTVKHKKLKNTNVKFNQKVTSWDAAVGATYRF